MINNCFVNYKATKILTFPNLSIVPMEYTYLNKNPTSGSEINIESGFEELDIIIKNRELRELYDIQQSIYNSASIVYRLLYRITLLLENFFNPNSYYNTQDYEYRKISKLIHDRINSLDAIAQSDWESLSDCILFMDQSLIKLHSILFDIHNIKTATACNDLRNYFSLKPPEKTISKMDDYITKNHSESRAELILHAFTEVRPVFMHIMLTSSIQIEKNPPDKNGWIRVHFKDSEDDGGSEGNFDFRNNKIGIFYYDLMCAFLHDAMPSYTKPDNISKKYLACNILCTNIVMELLIINWSSLIKYVKGYYNKEMGRYVFSKIAYGLYSGDLKEDNPIYYSALDFHVGFMRIAELMDMEIKKYSKDFSRYIEHIQTTLPRSHINPILHKKYLGRYTE